MTNDGELRGGADAIEPRDPVLARLQPRWSATRTEDNLAVAFSRIDRARRRRRVGVVGAVALGALALVAGWTARRQDAVTPSVASRGVEGAASRRLELPEGSTVALGDARARAVVSRTSPDRLELEVGGGPATIEVPARARVVVVRTARVEMTILAAKFELVPDAERVRLAVSDGQVTVGWPGAAAPVTVGRGGSAVFPPDAPARAPRGVSSDGPSAASADAPPEAPRGSAVSPELRSRFRRQVARRDYAAAYRSLEAAPDVADHSPEDLMLAADAARLSGHPASAVPYLRRLLRDHPTDVRGPVAAFTLGRVLLAALARPAEAADAFALAYRLAPSGPLALDALAREVEAAARAGDTARAHRLAAAYLARDPRGPRAAEVRRAGGLE